MSRYYRTLLGLGSSPPPPPTLVADLVSGFIHGYSQARKLRSAYAGDILQVRRSSDNTTLNIGFSSDELDESALTTFVGANDGFTRNLYDQIGGRTLFVSDEAFQPKIVDSGTVIKVSGKPYAQYDGSNDFLSTGSATPITDLDCTVFVVFESQAGTNNSGVFSEQVTATSVNRNIIFSDTRVTPNNFGVYSPDTTVSVLAFSSQQPTSTKRCLILRKSGTTIEAYDESGFVDSLTSADTFSVDTVLELGRQLAGTLYFGGKIAELLINNTALSTTDRNLVLDNIKDFYSIV